MQPSAPMLGMVEMRLSDDDRRAIAALVAAALADRMQLTDDALSPLSQQDAARLLGVDRSTLIAWERNGTLRPFLREGKIIKYSRQQIAAFLGGGDQ